MISAFSDFLSRFLFLLIWNGEEFELNDFARIWRDRGREVYIYINNVSVLILCIYYGQTLLTSHKKLHFLFLKWSISSVNATIVKYFAERPGKARMKEPKKDLSKSWRQRQCRQKCQIICWLWNFYKNLPLWLEAWHSECFVNKKILSLLQFLNSCSAVAVLHLAHFHVV